MELIPTLRLLNRMFSYGKFDNDPEFWFSLLQKQLDEAKQHHEAGKPLKMVNELCDIIGVAWNAIEKLGHDDPEILMLSRIDRRIIPDVANIITKYKNGYMKEVEARASQEE